MKKYLVLILIAIGTAFGSQATETNKIVNQAETAVQSVSDAADSLTVNVKQTAASVDTSQLYKSIYQDMKTGLQAMAVMIHGFPDINIGNKTTNNYYDGEERDD